jgi:5-methylcytosine-specific restriction endonuclease McrA
VRPQEDSYPEVVEHVLSAICRDGADAGAETLASIAYPPRDLPPRPALPRRVAVDIFRRDRFRCRYCDGRTILQPISRLLGSDYSDAYPWHLNWKAGRTHPAIIARTTVVDHVIPGTQCGDWTDPRNMVTACWPCNSIKADPTLDQLGWTVWPISSDPLGRACRPVPAGLGSRRTPRRELPRRLAGASRARIV